MMMRDIVRFNPDDGLLRDLVVFDLETTGLSPGSDEIIQIAALRVVDGRIRPDDRFFSYVKPSRPIDPFIIDFTGITNEDVREAPLPRQAVGRFSDFCGDSLLVAHNGHAFDVPFLENSFTKSRKQTRQVSYIDSMHLSWQIWGRRRGVSHSLDHLVSRLRVRNDGVRRHDARGDVTLLAGCLLSLLDLMRTSERHHQLSVYRCHLPAISHRKGGV